MHDVVAPEVVGLDLDTARGPAGREAGEREGGRPVRPGHRGPDEAIPEVAAHDRASDAAACQRHLDLAGVAGPRYESARHEKPADPAVSGWPPRRGSDHDPLGMRLAPRFASLERNAIEIGDEEDLPRFWRAGVQEVRRPFKCAPKVRCHVRGGERGEPRASLLHREGQRRPRGRPGLDDPDPVPRSGPLECLGGPGADRVEEPPVSDDGPRCNSVVHDDCESGRRVVAPTEGEYEPGAGEDGEEHGRDPQGEEQELAEPHDTRVLPRGALEIAERREDKGPRIAPPEEVNQERHGECHRGKEEEGT